MAKVTVKCSNCGEDIQKSAWAVKRSKNNFCNRTCQGEWNKKNLIGNKSPRYKERQCVHCENCGAKLMRVPSLVSKKNFCNSDCKYQWQKKNSLSGSEHPLYLPHAIVRCSWCNSTIERHKSVIRNQENSFCNLDCHYEWLRKYAPSGESHPNWRGGKITVECSWCGKEIERWPHEVKRRSKNFFCCRKHQWKWFSEIFRLENNPNWRGGYNNNYGPNWDEQRRKARERDGYRCRMCGTLQNELRRELDVHHIVSFYEFGYIPNENDHYLRANRLNNLVSLCPECHGRANFMTPADLALRLIAL